MSGDALSKYMVNIHAGDLNPFSHQAGSGQHQTAVGTVVIVCRPQRNYLRVHFVCGAANQNMMVVCITN